MGKVRVLHDSDRELRLHHPHVSGWIFAAIGCGMAWAGQRFVEPGFGRWMVVGMGLVFALIGLGGALWRYELTLDLMARCYRGRRGFWPSPRPLQGSLDELNGVILTRSWRSSSSSEGHDSEHAIWVVSLDFRGWDEPVGIYESVSERKGYAKLEHFARRLRTHAIDRTGDAEIRRAWDALDRPLASTTAHREGAHDGAASPGETPPGSGIEQSRSERGGPMILLPAAGFGIGTVFLALFGLPFFGFGLVAILAVSGVVDVTFEGSTSSAWIVGGVFVLLGSTFWLGAIFGSVARELIRQDADQLIVSLRAFGKEYRKRPFELRAIEEIEIKPSTSEHAHRRRRKRDASSPTSNQLVIRSDRRVVRIGDDLTAAEQEWLRDAIRHMIRR